MATRQPPSVVGMIQPNLEAMGKTLNERIAEAQAKGDKKEVERLNFAAGIQSAATGFFTSLPDLGVLGYNWATTSNIKDLRTRVLEASGVPTKATDSSNELLYNLPDYTVMAVSLGSLIKSGGKGIKNIIQQRKVNEFAKNLPPQQANKFRNFMFKGQGSNDPMVIEALSQLRRDPRYAELFNQLDKAATKHALNGIAPRPSRISQPQAARDIATAVQDKLDDVKRARDSAGNANFSKAFALAGDRPIVDTSDVRAAITQLRQRYGNVDSDNARAVQRVLDRFEESFANGDKLSVPQVQQLLHEFGKKLGSEDSIIQGLNKTDLDTIYNAIFGSLKSDLSKSVKLVTDPNDKKALAALIVARNEFAKGSAEYNRLISQGIPAFLQNKTLDEISFEDLSKAYKKLNPSQRTLFRDWVGTNKAEALQALDKAAFDGFLSKAFKPLPDGTMGYDLRTLAQNWQKLQQTNPNEADMIVKALGTNAAEFNARMKDALIFTRRMDVGGGFPDAVGTGALEQIKRAAVGVVGSTGAGYQGAKATDLSFQIAQSLTNRTGLTSEQLMRLILTPEGANFLKTAALSPSGAKTLEALTKIDSAVPSLPTWMAAAGSTTGVMTREPVEDDIVIPDDIMIPEEVNEPSRQGQSQQQEPSMDMEDDIVIPDEVLNSIGQMSNTAVQTFAGADQRIERVLASMKQADPYLNVDYVRRAYENADPAAKQRLLQQLGQ